MKPLSAVNVAKYLLTHLEPSKGETMSPIVLQLLLYFAQKEHIYRKLRPLFQEPIIRWVTMPVVTQVWDMYKKYGENSINVESEYLDYGDIDNNTKKFLDFIYNKYFRLPANKLYTKAMRQIEIKRTELSHEVSFDVMYGKNGNLPVSFSMDTEFKQVYFYLLLLIKEFKVKKFVVRRLNNKTLDVLLVSKEFEGKSESDNVRALVDFMLDNCSNLHYGWFVEFRTKGIKRSTKTNDFCINNQP